MRVWDSYQHLAIVVAVYYIVGSTIAEFWLSKFAIGFESKRTIGLLATAFGVFIAVIGKLITLLFHLKFNAACVVFVAGLMVAGSTKGKARPKDEPEALHELRLLLDDTYYKKYVLKGFPLFAYFLTAAALFFIGIF